MRLLLSSYRLGARVHELAELAGAPARVAVVANALDNLPDFPRDNWLHEEYSTLTGAGLARHELDLRGFYGQPHKLRPALSYRHDLGHRPECVRAEGRDEAKRP